MYQNDSKEISDVIQRFLSNEDWNYEFQEEKGIFRFGLNLKCRIRNIQYIIDVNNTDYNEYGLIPLSANRNDQNEMAQIAEFLCRANYGLRNGNFELDFRDGEIRYKCYVDCKGLDAPTEEMVKHSIYCPAAMFERYGNGILQILFAEMSAEEAISLCEPTQQGEESRKCDEAQEASSSITSIRRDSPDETLKQLLQILREDS